MPIIKIYNQAAIADWENEAAKLDNTVKANEKEVRELQEANDGLSSRIIKLEEELADANYKITRFEDETRESRQHHEAKHHDQNSFWDNINDISREWQTSNTRDSLYKVKNSIENRLSPLRREHEENENNIDRLRRKNNQSSSKIQLYYNDINAAKGFLNRLETNPEGFFREFCLKLKTAFKRYDQADYEQEDEVRLALEDIEKKIDTILTDDQTALHSDPFYSNYDDYLHSFQKKKTEQQIKAENQREWQIKYAQICGFLWDLYHQIELSQKKENEAFLRFLSNQLEQTHIMDDLPDNLGTGKNLYLNFDDVAKKHKDLYYKSLEKFLKEEKDRFDNALIDLYNATRLQHLTKKEAPSECWKQHRDFMLRDEGRRFYNLMLTESQQTQPSYFHKVGSEALQLMCEAVSQPDQMSSTSKERMHDVADHLSGHPSKWKKIGGALMMAVGTLIVIGSLLAFFHTFGTSVITAKIGFSLFMGGMSAFGLLGGSGLGLFASGMRHGASQRLANAEHLTNQAEPTHTCSPCFSH